VGAPTELQKLCDALNGDDWHFTLEYQAAIKAWPDSILIWPHLESDFARYRYARFVMNLEEPKTYLPGRRLPNSLDLTFCYQCRHFARERFYKYSMAQQDLHFDSEYAFEKALRKYQIPIHEVGQDIPGARVGHASNAVYLGAADSDPRDVMNWMFFEPQRNWIDHSADRPQALSHKPRFKAGTVLHVYPTKHSAVLDRHSFTPSFLAGDGSEQQGSYIFAVDRDHNLRNFKMAALDGFASAVPPSVAVQIVRHQYNVLRYLFLRQHSDQARDSIIQSIRLWGDWPEKQIEFFVRLRNFMSRIESRHSSSSTIRISEDIANVFVYLNDSSEWDYLRDRPWFKELIEFLDSEHKFLRLKIPAEFILEVDAERVLGALEACVAKLRKSQ